VRSYRRLGLSSRAMMPIGWIDFVIEFGAHDSARVAIQCGSTRPRKSTIGIAVMRTLLPGEFDDSSRVERWLQ
jgi:hypothetical protein